MPGQGRSCTSSLRDLGKLMNLSGLSFLVYEMGTLMVLPAKGSTGDEKELTWKVPPTVWGYTASANRC